MNKIIEQYRDICYRQDVKKRELEEEIKVLKVVITTNIIIMIALVMATQYALFGSIL